MSDRETREKRLRIRAWRRGMREMDMLLGPYADAALAALSEAELDAFEALMEVNDQTLFAWACGVETPAPEHSNAIARVMAHRETAG